MHLQKKKKKKCSAILWLNNKQKLHGLQKRGAEVGIEIMTNFQLKHKGCVVSDLSEVTLFHRRCVLDFSTSFKKRPKFFLHVCFCSHCHE